MFDCYSVSDCYSVFDCYNNIIIIQYLYSARSIKIALGRFTNIPKNKCVKNTKHTVSKSMKVAFDKYEQNKKYKIKIDK